MPPVKKKQVRKLSEKLLDLEKLMEHQEITILSEKIHLKKEFIEYGERSVKFRAKECRLLGKFVADARKLTRNKAQHLGEADSKIRKISRTTKKIRVRIDSIRKKVQRNRQTIDQVRQALQFDEEELAEKQKNFETKEKLLETPLDFSVKAAAETIPLTKISLVPAMKPVPTSGKKIAQKSSKSVSTKKPGKNMPSTSVSTENPVDAPTEEIPEKKLSVIVPNQPAYSTAEPYGNTILAAENALITVGTDFSDSAGSYSSSFYGYWKQVSSTSQSSHNFHPNIYPTEEEVQSVTLENPLAMVFCRFPINDDQNISSTQELITQNSVSGNNLSPVLPAHNSVYVTQGPAILSSTEVFWPAHWTLL